MSDEKGQYGGGCLCGAVRYRVTGTLSDVHACHCGQCRRQSGHFTAGCETARDNLTIDGAEALRWYKSSSVARRGFCGTCGSNLFWDGGGQDISLNAGTLDQPTGLKMTSHIFVADKADYYEIDDGLPRHQTYPDPPSV